MFVFQFNDNSIQNIKRHPIDLQKTLTQHNQVLNKVQDTNLMIMVDPGLCLSMHQPNASLLLLNIKRYFYCFISKLMLKYSLLWSLRYCNIYSINFFNYLKCILFFYFTKLYFIVTSYAFRRFY